MEYAPENVMVKLFEAHRNQCPESKIRYALYDETKSQGHIVLEEGIEIIHFLNYRGGDAIKFAFARGEQGDEYFFDTYKDAIKYGDMDEDSFEEYVQSITI